MSEWQHIPLSELIIPGRGISYGIVQPGTHQDDGVPILRVADIRDGRISVSQPMRVSSEIEAAHARTRLRGGELLLTLVGTVGEAAIAPPELAGWNVARAVAVIPIRQEVGAYWVKLALSAQSVREMIHGRLNTTVQATLNLKDVAQLPILMPDSAARESIAAIIGSLDNKIELNRRMNETLEAMARAIFKSWFVDFDPVRAKASGEPPESIRRRLGLTPEILALFPDAFNDSELGEIPAGWNIKPLGQVAAYLNRGVSPKYVEEGGVLVLNQKCVRDGKVSLANARRHDPALRPIAGRELSLGDILVNSTGMGTLGRVAQVLTLDEPSIVDSHITVVRANQTVCPPSYLFMTLRHRQPEIEALGEGSTGQTELSRARLAMLKILAPPVGLMCCFDMRVRALRETLNQNDRQNLSLAGIRDTLLPKLLSGDIATNNIGSSAWPMFNSPSPKPTP